MKKPWKLFVIVIMMLALMGVATSQSGNKSSAEAKQKATAAPAIQIGDAPVVTLTRPASAKKETPQLLEATVLPGRGMNLLQLKAYLPGKGEVNLLHSPSLEEAKPYLEAADDEYGYNAFKIGGAVLLPWANRIRGTVQPNGKTIEANVGDKKVMLPAAWSGHNPGAERHAIHGLMLRSKFQNVKQSKTPTQSSVSALLHAGNFDGHWPSQTDVTVQTVLKNDALEMTVTAKNVGRETLPMGIGLHPYFEFPSGDRKQARLHVPAESRAEVNNPDDVFPTGKLLPLAGTPYDFSAPESKALGDIFLDENFLNIHRGSDGAAVVEVIDPAAKYGLRIKALSPEVKAIQVYAPPDKNFVAVEPQFNWNDPFGNQWEGKDTGMVKLRPGQSVSWRLRIELFTPSESTK